MNTQFEVITRMGSAHGLCTEMYSLIRVEGKTTERTFGFFKHAYTHTHIELLDFPQVEILVMMNRPAFVLLKNTTAKLKTVMLMAVSH